jgi:serine/threonine-protein kinase
VVAAFSQPIEVLDPLPDPLIGQQLGGYVLDAALWPEPQRYRGHRVSDRAVVAIKVLRGDQVSDEPARLRLEREARLCGKITHPNVIAIRDTGVAHGVRFVVLELVEGPTLAGWLTLSPMPGPEVATLAHQLCAALAAVHDAGYVHRAVTPGNVELSVRPGGKRQARLTSFGVALIQGAQAEAARDARLGMIGEPAYWAPEQGLRAAVDARTDLFALGVVLYHALAGRLPFDGDDRAMAKANITREPPPIALRGWHPVDPLLEAFARRLMARRPSKRPPSAHAALGLLSRIERDPDGARRELARELAPPEERDADDERRAVDAVLAELGKT